MTKYTHARGRPVSDQLRELAAIKTGDSQTVVIDVANAEQPIAKTVAHGLGRIPQEWRVTRAAPDSGTFGTVSEPITGSWATATTITLVMPGNGRWHVAIS